VATKVTLAYTCEPVVIVAYLMIAAHDDFRLIHQLRLDVRTKHTPIVALTRARLALGAITRTRRAV
jgi:hypothetical protein